MPWRSSSGTLVEHNLAVGNETIETVRRGRARSSASAPTTSTGSPAPIHGSVSVHAYSPPLWRMGQYAVGADGVLRRQSVSYADELRPIE